MREPVEGEIIDEGSSVKKSTYTGYIHKPPDSSVGWVWVMGIVALLTSLIPVVGFVTALVTMVVSIIKKVPPILPTIALIVSSIVTSIFLFVWLVLNMIF